MAPSKLPLVALLGLLVACGDHATAPSETAGSGDSGVRGATSGVGGADGEATNAGADELKSVFPLPPGRASAISAYQLDEDEDVRNERATFLVEDTSVDAVVAFYQETLPPLGYELGEPIQLGGSKAINVTHPDRPRMTAVVQAGVNEPGVPNIQVHQDLSEFKK